MHRTGFGEPALSPGPLVGSYPTVSPLPAATPEIRDRRSVFCATFRRLSPPPSRDGSVLPCGVRTFLDALAKRRGHPACRSDCTRYRAAQPRRLDPPVQAHRALGAAHGGALVEDELAADRALERRAAQHARGAPARASGGGSRRAHSSRNTPTTLPRICDVRRRRSARARCSPAAAGRGPFSR